jgi:hypothetical protein
MVGACPGRVHGKPWVLLALSFSLLGCRPPPCEQPTADHLTDPLACRPDTPEYEAARARLDALDRQLEAANFADPVEPLNAAIVELRATRCFERSVEHSESIAAESSASLREWWSRGGRVWLASYLHVHVPGDLLVLPPTPRRVLYAEGVSKPALQRLVCPHPQPRRERFGSSLAPDFNAGECGSETVAWLMTAHQAHEYWAVWSKNWQVPAMSARWQSITPGDGLLRQNPVGERCRDAIEHDLRPSYIRFRACVEAERGRMSMLPEGAFRQPEHGWLITRYIVFRAYDGCSDYTAYHLDTGAAHWGRRCESGNDERHSGTVPADRVREALLLSILADYAVDGAPFADAVRSPDGVPIVWPERARPLGWREPELGVRIDHETTVVYRWWDQEVIAEGRVDGPYHGTGAEAHARSLHFNLAISRREGPAPTELPDELWASFARDPD